MSSPKAPTQQRVLPLVDPNNVQEVFAHECSGVQCRSDGTCHFTFSVIRPDHRVSNVGIMQSEPDEVRAVTLRLVMPMPGVAGLHEVLRQMQVAMTQHQMLAQSKPH